MDTLADRARAASIEVELERHAHEEQRLDRDRHDATDRAGSMVAEWLRTQNVENMAWTLGHPEPRGYQGRWRVPVRFAGPAPDDDLELHLELELGDPEHAGWWLPKVCAKCGRIYASPAGWQLADIGRALNESRLHECEAPASVVVEVVALPSDGPAPRAVERMARLTLLGYDLETIPGPYGLVIIGRHLDAVSDDEPF